MDQTVASIQAQLEPAPQACASNRFSATDPAEIDTVVAQIINALESKLRLVQ